MTSKRHHRSRADRARHGRRLGWTLLAAIALPVAGFLIDRTGPEENIRAQIVETSTYTHSQGDREGIHTHVEAILEYEGKRHTLRPADRLREGDRVAVVVRRGRLTGYPYFVAAGIEQGR